jgi:hypothetical protein
MKALFFLRFYNIAQEKPIKKTEEGNANAGKKRRGK